MRFAKRLALVLLLVFIAPALACAAWWTVVDRPASWRQADWGSSGVLPAAGDDEDAAIYVLAARTGGMKGAFATHSWIVTREAGADTYSRYDKVGWGSPIRGNSYAADGRWYSNLPSVVGVLRGEPAERLIPQIEAAIAAYPYDGRNGREGYAIYPGPNSNTFVAHVLREVPALGIVLPPNAVGRDYRGDGRFLAIADDWRDIHVSLYGLAGFSAGLRSGIEVHFMGLVAGIDIRNVGLKIPAFGLVTFRGPVV
jgi:hypothetical protein